MAALHNAPGTVDHDRMGSAVGRPIDSTIVKLHQGPPPVLPCGLSTLPSHLSGFSAEFDASGLGWTGASGRISHGTSKSELQASKPSLPGGLRGGVLRQPVRGPLFYVDPTQAHAIQAQLPDDLTAGLNDEQHNAVVAALVPANWQHVDVQGDLRNGPLRLSYTAPGPGQGPMQPQVNVRAGIDVRMVQSDGQPLARQRLTSLHVSTAAFDVTVPVRQERFMANGIDASIVATVGGDPAVLAALTGAMPHAGRRGFTEDGQMQLHYTPPGHQRELTVRLQRSFGNTFQVVDARFAAAVSAASPALPAAPTSTQPTEFTQASMAWLTTDLAGPRLPPPVVGVMTYLISPGAPRPVPGFSSASTKYGWRLSYEGLVDFGAKGNPADMQKWKVQFELVRQEPDHHLEVCTAIFHPSRQTLPSFVARQEDGLYNPMAPRSGAMANLPSYSSRSSTSRARSPTPLDEPSGQPVMRKQRTEGPVDVEDAELRVGLSSLHTSETPTHLLTQQAYRTYMGPGNERAGVCWAIAVGVAVGVGITPDIVNQVPDGAAGDGNTMERKQTLALLEHLGLQVGEVASFEELMFSSAGWALDGLRMQIGPDAAYDRAVLLYRGSDGASGHHVTVYREDSGQFMLHDGATGPDLVPVTLEEVVKLTYSRGKKEGCELHVFPFKLPEGGLPQQAQLQAAWQAFAGRRESVAAGEAALEEQPVDNAQVAGHAEEVTAPAELRQGPRHGDFTLSIRNASARWGDRIGLATPDARYRRQPEFHADGLLEGWPTRMLRERDILCDAADACRPIALRAAPNPDMVEVDAFERIWLFTNVPLGGQEITLFLKFSDDECRTVHDVRRVPRGGDPMRSQQLIDLQMVTGRHGAQGRLPFASTYSQLASEWNRTTALVAWFRETGLFDAWRAVHPGSADYYLARDALLVCRDAQQRGGQGVETTDAGNTYSQRFDVRFFEQNLMFEVRFADPEHRQYRSLLRWEVRDEATGNPPG